MNLLIVLSIFSDWGIFSLRVALGAILIVHGWPKLKNIKTIGGNFAAMGFWPGAFWGPVVAIVEFFGGLALTLGFFTQIAAALFVGQFIVIIIWRMIKKHTFIGAIELDLIILAASLALLTLGGGAFSLDRYLFLFGF